MTTKLCRAALPAPWLVAMATHLPEASPERKGFALAHRVNANPSWQGSHAGWKTHDAPTVRKQTEVSAASGLARSLRRPPPQSTSRHGAVYIQGESALCS